jgi:hypothetical protein
VPGLVGLVLAGVGVGLFVVSKGDAAELRMPALPIDAERLMGVAARGQAFEATGVTMMIVGGAAIAVSLVWWLLGGASP